MVRLRDAYRAKVSIINAALDDMPVESRCFRRLFPPQASQLLKLTPSVEHELLVNLSTIVRLMRVKPGVDIETIVRETGFSSGDVRDFIQILLMLGGQVEVLNKNSECNATLCFLLRN